MRVRPWILRVQVDVKDERDLMYLDTVRRNGKNQLGGDVDGYGQSAQGARAYVEMNLDNVSISLLKRVFDDT